MFSTGKSSPRKNFVAPRKIIVSKELVSEKLASNRHRLSTGDGNVVGDSAVASFLHLEDGPLTSSYHKRMLFQAPFCLDHSGDKELAVMD